MFILVFVFHDGNFPKISGDICVFWFRLPKILITSSDVVYMCECVPGCIWILLGVRKGSKLVEYPIEWPGGKLCFLLETPSFHYRWPFLTGVLASILKDHSMAGLVGRSLLIGLPVPNWRKGLGFHYSLYRLPFSISVFI